MSQTVVAPERRLHPAGTARPRPDLHIVRPDELGARARRRRQRLVTVAVSLLVAASLFGVVVSHVVLTEGQLQLDRMRAEAADQAANNARLRLQVAQLESPDWIVASAGKLGLVPAKHVTYLSVPAAARTRTRG